MSRSRRKAPIFGITTCTSEKADKVAAHRMARAGLRVALAAGDEPPHPKAHGDPWKGGKDGKRYWREAPAEMMRK